MVFITLFSPYIWVLLILLGATGGFLSNWLWPKNKFEIGENDPELCRWNGFGEYNPVWYMADLNADWMTSMMRHNVDMIMSINAKSIVHKPAPSGNQVQMSLILIT